MSESQDETPAADGQGGGESGSGDSSLHQVNERLDRIEGVLARLVPGSHAEAQQRTEEHLDRGTTVQEQVQAELRKAREQEAAAAAAEQDKSDRQSVRERLAALEEVPPRPPARRATRSLGWGA